MYLCLRCRLHLLSTTVKESLWLSRDFGTALRAFTRRGVKAPSHGVPRQRHSRQGCKATSTSTDKLHTPNASTPLHIPVLLEEVLGVFADRSLPVFVDATLGAGGHAAALLAAHPELRRLIGIDVDPTALATARNRLEEVRTTCGSAAELTFRQGNFARLGSLLNELPGASAHPGVDGILMDLGFSSMQIDNPERGFSFLRDGPLDMRMGPSAPHSALEIINGWAEDELGRVFREYGEERFWRSIAQRIVEVRESAPIETTGDLVAAIGSGSFKGRRPGARHINPATRVFQALRIAVNDELRVLEEALPAAIGALAPGGRLAVITFHSLEDRAVKRAFLHAAGRLDASDEPYMARRYLPTEPAAEVAACGKLLTRRPLVPSDAEAAANPRSRSAKLRVLEKL